MATWVDFRQLRERLSFAEILKDYGVELRIKGDRASGFCPLPTHEGQRKSPSFSVHLQRGCFHCFGCQSSGNLIEFAVLMEKLDPGNPADFRKIALKLQERYGIQSQRPANGRTNSDKPAAIEKVMPRASQPPEPKKQAVEADPKKVAINISLDFTLKNLESAHPYLASRELNPETIEHFGLGYCNRGLMAGRIAIPLHDAAGNLIGYAGRIVDDTRISPDDPKYRFPSPRERDGVTCEFRKSLFLYHGFDLPQPVSNLIIVEGFPATWWLWQAGYPNVVALMGASCSTEQAALIVERVSANGRAWIFPDGDDAGAKMANSVFSQVALHRSVRLIGLGAGKQPTDCSPAALADLFGAPGAEGSGS